MEYSITLPASQQPMTIRDLLEKEWLVPRKVRHFLRVRKNVLLNHETAMFHQEIKNISSLMATKTLKNLFVF